MSMSFEEKRQQYTQGLADTGHLNNALIGLICATTRNALVEMADLQRADPIAYARRGIKAESEAKRLAAGLIGAGKAEDISLVQNTSTAISIVAHGLLGASSRRPEANIVLMADEYPSNREVWLALAAKYGCDARLIEPGDSLNPCREQLIEQACDRNTLAVALSAVQYSNGYAHNLGRIGEFCHRRGIFLMVDGIQACGVMAIDIESCRINALACGGHKWLMTPEGVGFMYTDERSRGQIDPLLYGWRTLSHSTAGTAPDTSLRVDGRKYESGTQPSYLIAAMAASLSMIADLEVTAISRYLWDLRRELVDILSDCDSAATALPFDGQFDAATASPILSIAVGERDPSEIVRRLAEENGLFVMNREQKLRISPHIYNTGSKISELGKALKAFCG